MLAEGRERRFECLGEPANIAKAVSFVANPDTDRSTVSPFTAAAVLFQFPPLTPSNA